MLLQADLLAGVGHSLLQPLFYPTPHLSSGKMAADFIYTLDSEPGSDIEQDDDSHTESEGAIVGTSRLTSPKLSANFKNAAPKNQDKSKTKKSFAYSEDAEEDEAAPAIDPSFNFDLGGGADGTTFFDGLGGDGMSDADEVRTGTKPVCLNTFAWFMLASIAVLEPNLDTD